MSHSNTDILLEYAKIRENIVASTNSITKQNLPSAKKEGTLQLVSPDGKVLGTYKFVNGGGGRGFIPGGTYSVTGREGLAPSDVQPMTVGGVGYKYRVLTSDGNPNIPDARFPNAPRSGILIHPDGNYPGTNGCIGITGGADVQKDFMQKMDSLIQQGGGKYTFNFDSGKPVQSVQSPATTNAPVAAAAAPAVAAAAPVAAAPDGSFNSFMNMINSFKPAAAGAQPSETPFGQLATTATKGASTSKPGFASGRMNKPAWASK